MKLKKALIIATVFSSIATSSYANNFKDLQGYAWAEKYINDVTNKGMVTGYPDKSFKPANPVTRIEALVMISNLYPKSNIDNTYKNSLSKYKTKLDSAKIEEWARPYVVFALENNIIPNTDKMINSLVDSATKKSITSYRYEVCVFLVRGLGLESEINKGAKLSYKDNKDILSQAVPYIELLQRKGIISKVGDGNGYFFPNKTTNRAEVAVMLSNAYKYSPKAKGVSSTPNIQNPSNVVPPQQVAPKTQTINGRINLITLIDNNVTLSIVTDDNKIQNYTFDKKTVSTKIGDSVTSINELKVGQDVSLTLVDSKLSQISAKELQQRISGKVISYYSEAKTLTIAVDGINKIYNYTDNTKIYLNDELTSIEKLPQNADIDAYITGNTIDKASVVYSKSEFKGEVVDFTNNSITIINDKNEKITKQLNDSIKIYRNDKRLENINLIAIGDNATIITDNDKVNVIDIKSEQKIYTSSVIKSIQLTSDYNKIIISDKNKKEHILTVNNDSIIRIQDKKSNIYSLKVGYEVDVYANGGFVEEIVSRGDFQQTTISGVVIDIDIVDKSIEIKQNDGKTIKVTYNSDTKIEKLSNGLSIEARKIYKDDKLTAIGIINGGALSATRIIADF